MANQTIARNSNTGPLPFTVGDLQTPAVSLVVSATSSNTTLVPLSGIFLSGSGASRFVTVTPRTNRTGSATITLTVTDGGGLTATDTFIVRVRSGTGGGGLAPSFAVGSGSGGSVRVLNADGTERFAMEAFPGLTSGVRTATADFNGDGTDDVVVGTGPGVSTQVRVIDGATHQDLFGVQPFDGEFAGGVFVAVGDLTGDGTPDLVITPDEGGGPRARVFDGNDFTQLADYFGIEDTTFRGGARAAIGDVTGDGIGDLVVGAGYGGGPRVAVWDGASREDGTFTRKPFGDRLVFESSLRNGTYVAVGDLNGDGLGELIVGGGPGGGPRVMAFDGRALVGGEATEVANFFAGDVASRGGVRLATKDLDEDGLADLVTGAGRGARVTAYLATDLAAGAPQECLAFDAYTNSLDGVFVG